LAWPHLAHGRQPSIQSRQDAFQVRSVAAGAQFADGLRVTGPQPWIAADAATRTCRIVRQKGSADGTNGAGDP
jgi:hypothetical protein